MKRIVLYGLVGGLLIALLQIIEYKHFLHAYPSELYGGLIALIFASLGLYFGVSWSGRKGVGEEADTLDSRRLESDETLQHLGITPRENEILALIAEGLSNREIGDRLFISENTVKTHSSRLFQKLEVNRRTQAVRRGKELQLIP